MAEYSQGSARKFAEVAQAVVDRGLVHADDRRVVAYNSRISMEISLKAFLEQAGMPVTKIRAHSHRLRDLLAEIDRCDVEIVVAGATRISKGSRLRGVTVTIGDRQVPVGMILEAEDHGASRYPNELRYGAEPKDYPAEALAAGALAIADWVAEHAAGARWPL